MHALIPISRSRQVLPPGVARRPVLQPYLPCLLIPPFVVTLPDFPAPLARAPPDAKRPAASDDSQSDTAHS
eukprot:872272-Prymnesium_polylepis.1